jgi:hypothetical protein
MFYANRQAIYREIEADRNSKVIAFVTSDRNRLETIIASDAITPFVSLLDAIGPTQKLSLILHTNGGQTSSAWRLINLFRSFGDEIEVLVPTKAMSAGTLIALGADKIVMTKQAALGPIDPSLDNHPLNPDIGGKRIPVSAEAIRGYIDELRKDIKDPGLMAEIWKDLSSKVHPIVLGEIFRLGGQIRSMAKILIGRQVKDEDTQDKIINLLCSDSGSHDYTLNRRFASEIGLNVEKPSADLYEKLSAITKSYDAELKTFEPFSPSAMLAGQPHVTYSLVRGLIEATDVGCFGFVSEGEFSLIPGNPGAGPSLSDNPTFEGWRRLP